MQAFILDLENRPGSWAEVAEKIAQKGLNILGYGLRSDGKAYVGLVGSDEPTTRDTLDEISLQVPGSAAPSGHLGRRRAPGQPLARA